MNFLRGLTSILLTKFSITPPTQFVDGSTFLHNSESYEHKFLVIAHLEKLNWKHLIRNTNQLGNIAISLETLLIICKGYFFPKK